MAERNLFEDVKRHLEDISRAIEGSTPEDEETRRDRQDAEHRQAQIRRLEAEVEQLKSTTELRRKYAGHAYNFLRAWMVCIGILVSFQGFGVLGFQLSDAVLTAIVGGTAVSVVGLVLAVIKGLFGAAPPNPPSD